MNYRNNRWAGVTGHQFEEEFVRVAMIKVLWNGEYQTYRQAMDEIRCKQPANSALCDCGIKLRDELAKMMSVNPEELHFYASVGTCLDHKHKVDLFVDFQGKTVTIDLTMDPQKRGYKADVIVSTEDVDNGLWLAADRIAYAFKWK